MKQTITTWPNELIVGISSSLLRASGTILLLVAGSTLFGAKVKAHVDPPSTVSVNQVNE